YGLDHQYGLLPFPFVLCLAMNIVCCLVGRAAGASLGKHTSGLTDAGWHKSALIYSCLGAAWGAVTGAAGGFIAFGLGALFGAVCAIPVGVAAFLLFAPLHRLLRCGDMIDARQLWPLACGVTMTIVALILGL
ncbi:MAG TPA: hypothetical protein VD966_11425, partial [Pyrinomonadaceae bacterium]|nr:hypothetical protein [Pyrinomonadaceae bacterium]